MTDRKALARSRHLVAQEGPYQVKSRANDTYVVERVRARRRRHRKAADADCDGCMERGHGLFTRMRLADAIAAVLNARGRR